MHAGWHVEVRVGAVQASVPEGGAASRLPIPCFCAKIFELFVCFVLALLCNEFDII
jgi:hypothetical protein